MPILLLFVLVLFLWLYLEGHTLGSALASDLPTQSPSLLCADAGASSSQEQGVTGDRKTKMTEAEFIDQTWLRPHNSLLTGDMIVAVGKWYSPSEYRRRFKAVYLAVCAVETSLGDPVQGGRLVPEAFNFGCVKAGSPNTPWGMLASGTITVGGKRWWKWPTAWTGAAAEGRLLKKGPGHRPGFYLQCIHSEDWRGFSAMYYGASVPGYEDYHKRFERYVHLFEKRLREAGY